MTLRDLKEALGSARKPDITHVRKAIKYYIARACEYGSDKYERANFARPDKGTAKEQVAALRVYARAAAGHLDDFLESLEMHEAGDPNFDDIEGLRIAMYAEDTDAKPGCKTGPSGLPHLAHGAASLMMLLTKLVLGGWLPADPGTPWRRGSGESAGGSGHRLVKLEIDGVEFPPMPIQPAPPDNRDKCPHDLLVGRRCTSCDGGFARRDLDLTSR